MREAVERRPMRSSRRRQLARSASESLAKLAPNDLFRGPRPRDVLGPPSASTSPAFAASDVPVTWPGVTGGADRSRQLLEVLRAISETVAEDGLVDVHQQSGAVDDITGS